MKMLIVSCGCLALFGILFSPPAAQASSTPTDSVHFCVPFDYEQWRRDHPLPAAKWAADLNVGEPRTIRLIYFRPNDRPFRQEVVDSMKVRIRQVKRFFVDQMEAHGYGRRALRIETDVQGEPLVHRVNGQHPDSHYLDNTHVVYDEIDPVYDIERNIYVVVVDNSIDAIGIGGGRRAGGTGGRRGKSGGNALVPGNLHFELVAHELGHACGLYHDFHDGSFIMSYGPGRSRLSACHAEFLSVHPYFNPNTPVEFESKDVLPTIEVVSPRAYPAGSRRVSIRVKAIDSDGLFQVLLFGRTMPPHFAAGSLEVKACRGLDGQREASVEFEYDGSIPSALSSSLSEPVAHPLRVAAIDRKGNERSASLVLAETSTNQVATMEGHGSGVNSVVFSPRAPILASGSRDRTITIWQTETSTPIAHLTGHKYGVNSVAFSSDGATLASGSYDNSIKIWNLTTSAETGRLIGHAKGVRSVAFPASDKGILASGSDDGTVILWDLATREPIFTLDGHASGVNSVAFSPDGAILASGSRDGKVILWDVAAGEKTAEIEGHASGISSVAFAPDGAALASGSWDDTVILWDVETRKQMGTLEGHSGNVNSVSFAAGGALLATGGNDGTVILWDVLTRETITTFGYPGEVLSVSFSAGGALLAAGGRDGGVGLWDVSGWAGPRPFALEIVSGDGQQGAPGSALAHPMVVEVRDQFGNPLPQAQVTFTVTGGEGRLSGRFSTEHTTADGNGRAALSLTLGPHPGANTVIVSIGGRRLGEFYAEAVGTDISGLDGDYRTWHLPTAATARLGKGAMGEGDRAVALSADGRFLAVASAVGVWLYESATYRALALLPAKAPVHAVAFSPDGALASGRDGGIVQLWDVETATSAGILRHTHQGRITAVAFSPDGTRLASGSGGGTVRLWDVGTHNEMAALEAHSSGVHSVSFSRGGRALVSGGADGRVVLRDLETSNTSVVPGYYPLSCMALSPDGAFLASGGSDAAVRLWDAASKAHVATLDGHTADVTSISFPLDGAILASGSWDGTIKLWNARTRELIDTLEGHTRFLTSVSFSPDGVTLASGDRNGRLQIWNVETGELLDTLEGHTNRVVAISFSPDGGILATGSWDRTVKLWDAGTRRLIDTLDGHTGFLTSVSFSPDGATMVSGSRDGTVKLWDVETRQQIDRLEGRAGSVASFSIDGSTLAVGSYRDVTLWDVATRKQIGKGTLDGYPGSPRSVYFLPDDETLVTAHPDGTMLLWDLLLLQRRPESLLPVSGVEQQGSAGSALAEPFVVLVSDQNGNPVAGIVVNFKVTAGDGTLSATTATTDENGRASTTLTLGNLPGANTVVSTVANLEPVTFTAIATEGADFDGDGSVGFSDFVQFAGKFGLSQGDEGYDALFDLDGNGAIGFSDFLIFAGAFGKT